MEKVKNRLFGNPMSVVDNNETSERNFKISTKNVIETKVQEKFSKDLNVRIIEYVQSDEIQKLICENNYMLFTNKLLEFQGKSLNDALFMPSETGGAEPYGVTWFWTDLYVAAYVGAVVIQIVSQIDITPKIQDEMGEANLQSIANVLGAAKMAGGDEFGIAVGKYFDSKARELRLNGEGFSGVQPC